jgi:hypothetical protein
MANQDLYIKRYERERKARRNTEAFLEEKTVDLASKNIELSNTLTHLNNIVDERTKGLEKALLYQLQKVML